MRNRDILKAGVAAVALLVSMFGANEVALAKGTYRVTIERGEISRYKGLTPVTEVFHNVVCTVGKNLVWDSALAGSAYTVTGPYVGLISNASYTAVSAADTMTSHTGWLEAGSANAPTYSGTRPLVTWAAASGGAKAFASAASFPITGSGTIVGAFVVFGTGATSTIANTGGTLLSAGAFTGGNRAVNSGDTVNVSYSIAM